MGVYCGDVLHMFFYLTQMSKKLLEACSGTVHVWVFWSNRQKRCYSARDFKSCQDALLGAIHLECHPKRNTIFRDCQAAKCVRSAANHKCAPGSGPKLVPELFCIDRRK